MMLTRSTMSLVSCNVYVSAGRSQYKEILLSLLDRCQERCQKLRNGEIESKCKDFFQEVNCRKDYGISPKEDNSRKIALVHAYADESYDRSSFHLAGDAYLVADVASFIALDAIDSLRSYHKSVNYGVSADASIDSSDEAGSMVYESRHPLIGLVDHISVMPLLKVTNNHVDQKVFDGANKRKDNDKKIQNDTSAYIPPDAHGLSCMYIGQQLIKKDIDVLYYGSAHPKQTPLATVRREQTKFFKSGGLDNDESQSMAGEKPLDQCTVGSPPLFVENYNILLSQNVNRKKAMSLTKMIRARDGGIVGVEALTLPYSGGRFEVACNLLRPEEGSASDIEQVLDQWVKQEQGLYKEERGTECSKTHFVDYSYRVGTTSDQCIEVLNHYGLDQDGFIEKYEKNTRQKFISFMSN